MLSLILYTLSPPSIHTPVSTTISSLQPCYLSNVWQDTTYFFHLPQYFICNKPNLNSLTETYSSLFPLIFVNNIIIHRVAQAGNLEIILNYIFSLSLPIKPIDHIVTQVLYSKYYLICHTTIAVMFKLCSGQTLSSVCWQASSLFIALSIFHLPTCLNSLFPHYI